MAEVSLTIKERGFLWYLQKVRGTLPKDLCSLVWAGGGWLFLLLVAVAIVAYILVSVILGLTALMTGVWTSDAVFGVAILGLSAALLLFAAVGALFRNSSLIRTYYRAKKERYCPTVSYVEAEDA